MIQADKGKVKIGGDILDIMFEYNQIVNVLLKFAPEIYIASVKSWTDVTLNLVEKQNASELHFADIATTRLVNQLKERNNEQRNNQ